MVRDFVLANWKDEKKIIIKSPKIVWKVVSSTFSNIVGKKSKCYWLWSLNVWNANNEAKNTYLSH